MKIPHREIPHDSDGEVINDLSLRCGTDVLLHRVVLFLHFILIFLLAGCEIAEVDTLSTCLDLSTNSSSTDGDSSVTYATGIDANDDNDLLSLMWSLILGTAVLVLLLTCFHFLRKKFECLYAHNAKDANVPAIPDSQIGWARASYNLTLENVMDSAGLDAAMQVEFLSLGTKVCFCLGIPLAGILCPWHYFAGDQATDRLSQLSLGNLSGSLTYMYYIHAFLVWVVLFVVKTLMERSQVKFLALRFKWLRNMKSPRSTTVLVQHIPPEYRSDKKIRDFFGTIFDEHNIQDVEVVRHTEELHSLMMKRDVLKKVRDEVENHPRRHPCLTCWLKVTDSHKRFDEKEKYRKAMSRQVSQKMAENSMHVIDEWLAEYEEDIRKARHNVIEATEVGDFFHSAAFVTFTRHREAELALQVRYSADLRSWQVSAAPDPAEVCWNSLRIDDSKEKVFKLIGFGISVWLYFAFVPIIVGLTTFFLALDLVNPTAQEIWTAIMPSLILTLFRLALPSLVLLLFRRLYTGSCESWNQLRFQVWYFMFQLVFVILGTCIGASLLESLCEIARNPSEIASLLAEEMPAASNFYLSLIVMEWMTQGSYLVRWQNLLKYLIHRKKGSEQARLKAEPENQDRSGMGARSAHVSINFQVCIIFSTIQPLILVFGCISFAVTRIVYAYLVVYAETRKHDIGGYFWAVQVTQIWQGLFIYCILVTGIIHVKTGEWLAVTIVVLAIFYLAYSAREFERKYAWMRLPFDEKIKHHDVTRDLLSKPLSYKEPVLEKEFGDDTWPDKTSQEDTTAKTED